MAVGGSGWLGVHETAWEWTEGVEEKRFARGGGGGRWSHFSRPPPPLQGSRDGTPDARSGPKELIFTNIPV